MSKELISPPGSDKLQTNPEVGGAANELKDPSSQLAFLKDYSTAPATYLVMVDRYVMTTPDIAKASKFLVVNYGSGNWYMVTVGTAEYLSFTSRSYLYAYSSWTNARYMSIDPVSFNSYPGLYLYNGYVCCNGVADKPGELMNVHPEWIK